MLAGSLPVAVGAVHAVGAAQDDGPRAEARLGSPPDFSKPEPGEERPGGAATSRKSVGNANAFSHASGNMPFEKELDFKVGNGIFKKTWVSAPASTDSSDGLGPLFNSRSCQSCHLKDGRGHPPAPGADNAVSMLLKLSVPPRTDDNRAKLAKHTWQAVPEPTYGVQLQDLSIQGHDAEGRIRITYEEVPVTLVGGEVVTLRKPSYAIDELAYGTLDPEAMISPRIAPQMIGLGLLEAVPESQILESADPDDKDGDGISGRPAEAWSQEEKRIVLGRFGWKGATASIRQQVGVAFASDIGISNAVVASPSGDCTERQKFCLEAPNGNSERNDNFEASNVMLDLVTFYSRNLAVPARRGAGDADVLAGKRLFHAVGCAACHRPKLMTGQAARGEEHLSNQLIWPYTDLLLHDMGEGLSDNRPEGVASGHEWRTAPLWGVGLTQTVNEHEYLLHDGRARGVQEAILWHGGEAKKSRDAFAGLSKEERAKLIAFVKSL